MHIKNRAFFLFSSSNMPAFPVSILQCICLSVHCECLDGLNLLATLGSAACYAAMRSLLEILLSNP